MLTRRRTRGFTLTELAVVMVIIGFLLAGGIMTFNAQTDQRNYDETQRRLNAAVDAVLAFAIINRRLPCPAAPNTTTSAEALASGTTSTGGSCSNSFNGFLPAESIGFNYMDANRYGVDAWNNRLRYAVATTIINCTGTSLTPHFTHVANLKSNGVSCRPANLEVYTSAALTTRAVSTQTVAFIVFSTGKNGANPSAQGADEAENTNGDANFVNRLPGGTTSAFDDQMIVVPVGLLYQRMLSAGVLP